MKKKYLFIIVLFASSLLNISCNKAERDYNRIIRKEYRTMSDYEKYIKKYPNSPYLSAIVDSAAMYIIRFNSIFDIRENEYNGSDLYEIGHKLNQLLSDENSLWNIVKQKDDANSYDYFLETFPNSIHQEEAYKLLIERDVAEAFNGEHGILPSMDKGARTGRSYSTLEIENRTEYLLTISYSGPDYKRIKIPPHDKIVVKIGNGYYDVAARVKASNVRPFVGKETLDGSYFSSSFYISSTPSFGGYRY